MNLIIITILSIIIIIIGINYLDKFRMFMMITKFENYAVVLDFHKQKAYDIIYKDKILVYSIEGMRVNEQDFSVISKEFALLTMKLMGPNLKDEFISFYGDEGTLIFNLIEYFNSKFEEDEIRKKATDNLMDSEGNSQLIL